MTQALGADWSVGGGVSYVGARFANPGNTVTLPGYTVADASLAYQGRGYRVSLNVKNLFDREYYAGVLSNNVLPLGDPRVASLKAVFDF